MTIRKRKYPTARVKWVLDCGFVGGRRVQMAFETKGAAVQEMRERVRILRAEGAEGMSMLPRDRARYAAAERTLSAAGLTIEDAVRLALEHGNAVVRRVTVRELADEFIESREKMGARARYTRQLRVSLGGFASGRAETPAVELTREDVRGWLFGQGWAAGTIRNYAGDLRSMFNWAIRERLLWKSPAAGLDLPRRDADGEVSVLTPAQCGRLLEVCATARGPRWHPPSLSWRGDFPKYADLLGYVVVAMFAGVRPEELVKSSVAALDLAGATFVVAGEVGKTSRRRVVDLSPAAVRWLKLWRRLCPEQSRFFATNGKNKWRQLKKAAGLWPWPHDVLRHTFATMHFALHQNTAALKAQMGHHESEATLFRHYRAVRFADGSTVSAAEARKFWALSPKGVT